MRRWRWLGALTAVLLLAGCRALVSPLERELPAADPASNANVELVRVAACWEAEPLAHLLRSAYEAQHPEATALVTLTNSEHAMELLQSGEAVVGLIATPAGRAPETPEGWIARELAVDGIALVASPDVPLGNIATDDLARLYAGRVVDWAELGAGQGQPTFVTRERGAVLRQVFEGAIMGERPISAAAAVAPHNAALLALVASTPGALGYAPAVQVDERVRVVALDDRLPTRSQIERGGYPLRYSLWLVMPVSSEGLADGGALRLTSLALSARVGREIGAIYVRP